MAKVITFTVELNGIKGAITDGQSLAAAVKATNQEFKQADFGSAKYNKLQGQLGALKKIQADQRAETRKQGREFEIAADKGKRSYRGMNAQLVNLRSSFKELSEQERSSSFGKELVKQINVLDTELKELDKSIGNNQRNVGNYVSAFADLGGIDLASFATIPGAIAAGGAAAIQSAKFVRDLTNEFREFRGEVQALTGATGDDLDEFTSRLSGISETFDIPFDEVLIAANTLTDQLTGDFAESLDLIETGFIGNLDASGEFIQSLKEYPTFFSEAGLSGEQFLNIMDRQVDNGVFGDKGLDAVKEATIRLRELPKTAQDALAAIGISSQEIKKKIDEDGIGGAIETVAAKLGDFEDDSQEVGQVIADIFGGAGEDAGVDFIKSLSDISGATDEIIDKSNEYQLQQQRTLKVNQEFAAVQNEVAKQLGGTSASFDDLGTVIQTKALQLLVFLISYFKEVFVILQPVRDAVFQLGEAFGFVDEKGQATGRALSVLNGIVSAGKFAFELLGFVISTTVKGFSDFVGGIVDALEWLGVLDEESAKAAKSTGDLSQAQDKSAESAKALAASQAEVVKTTKKASDETKKYKKETEEATKEINKLTTANKQAAVVADKLAKDSISALRGEVNSLKKELGDSSQADAVGILSKLLNAEKALDDAEEFQRLLREKFTSGSIEPITILPSLSASVSENSGDVSLDSKLEIIEKEKLLKIEAARQVFESEKAFAIARSDIEAEAAKLAAQAKLSEAEEGSVAYLELQQEIADKEAEINQSKNEVLLQQEKDRAKEIKEISDALFSSIGESVEILSTFSEARYNNEVSALEDRYGREIELAGEDKDLKETLEAELAEEKEKIRKKEFEKQKKYRVASALASLAAGIVNTLSAPTTIPDPFGSIFKGIQVGILSATTIAQISKINSQSAAKGTLVKGQMKSDSLGLSGYGVARGATHGDRSGGIDTVLNGRRVKIEHGEFVDRDEFGGIAVVNKRSSAVFNRSLERGKGIAYPGKRAFLSGVNSYKNYGVAFMEEGGLIRPDVESLSSVPGASGGGNTIMRVELSDEQVNRLAIAQGQATRQGAEAGTMKGLGQANKEAEREARKNERAGLT